MFNKKNTNNSDASLKNIETIIGSGCDIIGDIKISNSIQINGIVHGKIYADGDVIIGENGKVKGDIECNELNVHGNIEGDVSVNTLRLRPTATLFGNIKTASLEVEHGSKYQGTVSMISDETSTQAIDDLTLNSYTLDEPK